MAEFHYASATSTMCSLPLVCARTSAMTSSLLKKARYVLVCHTQHTHTTQGLLFLLSIIISSSEAPTNRRMECKGETTTTTTSCAYTDRRGVRKGESERVAWANSSGMYLDLYRITLCTHTHKTAEKQILLLENCQTEKRRKRGFLIYITLWMAVMSLMRRTELWRSFFRKEFQQIWLDVIQSLPALPSWLEHLYPLLLLLLLHRHSVCICHKSSECCLIDKSTFHYSFSLW